MQHSEILKFFASYIEKELGIVYAEHNYFQLQNRLEDIMRLLGAESLASLYNQGRSGISGQFREMLLDIATNNETSFFRDSRVFKAMESLVFTQDLIPSGGTIRIWSAASSSGQEAISISILLSELSTRVGRNIDYSILGTDISGRILEKARKGVYSQLEVQRGLPAPLLVKYFHKTSDEQWAASPELMKHITFEKLNLKSDFRFTPKFHLILCRNVLIYQSIDGKKDILNRITRSLTTGGYLVLGAGESLLGLSSDYEQLSVDGSIIFKKKSVAMAA